MVLQSPFCPSARTLVIICASLCIFSLSLSLWPDLSVETVLGAAVVSVPVSSAAAAVSVQPGEGAAEPTAER